MKTILLLAAAAAMFAQAPNLLQNGGATPLPPDTIVAAVDGHDVSIAEIQTVIAAFGDPRLVQAFQQNPAAALQQVFTMRYLAEEGEKQKLAERSPLKEQLEILRQNIVAQAMLNQERDGFPVTSEQIDAFYARNQSRYEQAKIKVIQIAFKTGAPTGTTPEDLKRAAEQALNAAHGTGPQRTEAEAQALSVEIVTKLKEGADFVKLVAEYSDDPQSKAMEGDFLPIKANSSYPEDLKKAIFALRPGQLSDPVRQPGSFYIIRLEEKILQPIDQVREPIIQEIRQTHLGDVMNSLAKRFTPTIKNPQFFAQPALQPGSVAPAKPRP